MTIDLRDLLQLSWDRCDCLEVVRIGIQRHFGYSLDTSDPEAWRELFDEVQLPLEVGDVIVAESRDHTGVCIVINSENGEVFTSDPRRGVQLTLISMVQAFNTSVSYFRLKQSCVSA